MRTVKRRVLAALAAAAVMGVSPVATEAAHAADPVDVWVSIEGPTDPVRVGDQFTLTLSPHAADPATGYTITYDLPAGVELFATPCEVEAWTVTCTGTTVGDGHVLDLVATGAGSIVHTATIAGTEPDPTPDPTPNTASATTTANPSVKDVTLFSGGLGGRAGEVQLRVLDISRPSTATTDPLWAVGVIEWTFPASFEIVDFDYLAEASVNPIDPHFERGACSVDGQTVTCAITSELRANFLGVWVRPAEAGLFSTTATYTAGPGQTESHPSPTTLTVNVNVAPAATPAAITGSVEGTTNFPDNPIAGVVVDAFAIGATTPTGSATTDAAGSYRIDGVPAGQYHVRFTPPGSSPYPTQWYRSDGVASSRSTSEAVTVSGSGSNGTASIQLQDLDPSRIDHAAWELSPNEPAPTLTVNGSGTVVLTEQFLSFRRIDGVIPQPADETMTITVPAPATIDGAAFRFSGGTPDGSTCTIVTPQQVECSLVDPLDLALQITPRSPGPLPITVTNASNNAEAIPDVLPNTRTIEVATVAPTGQLSGRLVLADGTTPLAGALVLAYLPGDGWWPSQAAALATSGPDGGFALTDLVGGDYRIFVIPQASSGRPSQWLDLGTNRSGATVFPVTAGTPLAIGAHRVVAPRAIAGTVTTDGVPLAAARVRLFPTSGGYVPVATATAAADGTYVLSGIAPGDYYVRFVGPVDGSYRSDWYRDDEMYLRTLVTVGIEGTVTGIDGDLDPASTVSGVVSGPDGPVAGAKVSLYSNTDRYLASIEATTASDGTFTATGVPAGSYRVMVRPPAGSGLAAEWYEDSTDRWSATEVVVTTGSVTGIDVVLGP
jgi:hypothetical protein